MRKLIISLILLCCSVAPAPAATTDDLLEGAPERYVVVAGDTLWSISSRFLKSPWKWNELWKLNQEQIPTRTGSARATYWFWTAATTRCG